MFPLLLPLLGCAPPAGEDSSASNGVESARVDPWLAAAEARLGTVGAPGGPLPTLDVEVHARVSGPGAPATWSVSAGWGEGTPERPLKVGECRRPATDTHVPTPAADRLELLGSVDASLRWSAERARWEAEGPRRWLDPAWSMADLRWVDAAGAHTAEDAVRFGGTPAPTRVERAREGEVTLTWDPATTGVMHVLALGPAGALECGVGEGQTTLPWWSVPAEGGAVLLENTREYTALIDGTLLRVRTTIERVVPLDLPEGTIVEEKPPAPARPVPAAPPRRARSARVSIG